MRLAATVAMVAVLASACGSEEPASPQPPRRLPPLSMHPVLEVDFSGTCALTGDLIKRSADGTTCYSLTEGFTTTGYEAKRADSPGPGAAVEVTLEPSDMAAFNDLAEACFGRRAECPTQQIAIVVEDKIVSAPTVQAPSFTGSIMIAAADEDDLTLLLGGPEN